MIDLEQSIINRDIDFNDYRSGGSDKDNLISLLLENNMIVAIDFEVADICGDLADDCDDLCEEDDCWDACDDIFEECFFDALIFAEDEIYEWDESEVTNVAEFYRTGFPEFYGMAKDVCLEVGEWTETENEVGCNDMAWFMWWVCETETIQSAGEVCETIGGNYDCNSNELYVVCRLG